MRQMRIVGSILAVMLLLSACANAPGEEIVVAGTDFVLCDGLWNLGDSNAASFPDIKTLESVGFENYEDGYRLLIESEKKENYVIKVSSGFRTVIFL